MAATAKIDENLVKAIQLSAKYPSILRMGVFGSHARGEADTLSDVDIVYDYDDTQISDMLSCLADIEDRIKRKIDFVAYYLLFEDDMDEDDIGFRDSVLNDVVWVYEKR